MAQGHPVPKPPTATRLCLCPSPSQEAGRQMQVAWLYSAPSHLHPLSCSFFLPPPLQHTSSLKVISSLASRLMSPAARRSPLMRCSLKNFSMRGGCLCGPHISFFPPLKKLRTSQATIIMPTLRPLPPPSSSSSSLASPSSLHLALQQIFTHL